MIAAIGCLMTEPTQSVTGRAGIYIRQPNDYAAFFPKPLPPEPPLDVAGLQAVLSQADLALGRLDGAALTLPDSDVFVFMYIRKEALLSSQIEGTQSSLQDVLAVQGQLFAPARPIDAAEVVNYIGAMELGLQQLETLPVSIRLMRNIHRRLLQQDVRGANLTPGEVRTTQNWIGPPGAGIQDAIFVPRPARRRAELPGRPGTLPARRRRPTLTHSHWTRPRPIRDHPPLPRRQRTAWTASHNLPPHPAGRLTQTDALPLLLFRAKIASSTMNACRRCGTTVIGKAGSDSFFMESWRSPARRRTRYGRFRFSESRTGVRSLRRLEGPPLTGCGCLSACTGIPTSTSPQCRRSRGHHLPGPTNWCLAW